MVGKKGFKERRMGERSNGCDKRKEKDGRRGSVRKAGMKRSGEL